jgi:hypothetical protein
VRKKANATKTRKGKLKGTDCELLPHLGFLLHSEKNMEVSKPSLRRSGVRILRWKAGQTSGGLRMLKRLGATALEVAIIVFVAICVSLATIKALELIFD